MIIDTTKNDAARTGRRRADQMHNHVARVATRQSSNVLPVSSRRVRWSSLWINGGVRDGRAVDDVCISSSSERDRRPRRIPCRRRGGHHRGDVENNTHTTPETAWEKLANLALFCACVATIGILMGVRRARKMLFSQGEPQIEGQPATSRGDGLNNNNGQKSWNGSQWVEPAASVLSSPYRNSSTTSSHGVAASARPPDANWAKAKGPSSVWSGDDDGTNGANGSSLDNNNNDDINFATGFGYSEGVTSETARERAYRETLWARREAEELEAEENEEDQRHHHEYFTKHDEYEDRRSSSNKQQKTSSSSSSFSKKEKESAAAKRERRWSKFDQRWESLDASSSTSRLPLTYNDIPWPPKMAKLLERKISERQDASDATVLKKKVYRELIMRWHPDKFMQKYGKRVRAGGDEDRIKERVDAIAKSLSASMTSL